MTSRQRRTHTTKTGRKLPLFAEAGLRPLPGVKGRPWLDVLTGERISYNKGRERIAAISPQLRSKERKFQRLFKRTGNVEKARKGSGLSERGFVLVRSKTAVKEKGRYSFLPSQTELQDRARRVSNAKKARKLRAKIDNKTRNLAAKNGFRHGPNQTDEVLEFLKKQSAKHDRYLAGKESSRLDEDEYRRTVTLAHRYLGADDERLRNMLMSPDIMGLAP